MPALFQPFKLNDVTLRNRIAVSPMCQYSAHDGVPDDWHLVHLGALAKGGAGLVVAEATAVSPEGRISPGCTGLWNDTQADAFARIVRFVKGQGAVPGIQIAHAGRKASCNRPWEGDDSLEPNEGAWEAIAPSAVAFGAYIPVVPRAMTRDDIVRVRGAFVASAQRALAAGFEWLELHFAHGYLAHSFYSPLANQRTDDYGGSFENRTRFIRETFDAVRHVWPARFPLTVRLSVTDWIVGGVTIEESIELLKRLKAAGLDFVDVSQGFVVPDISMIPWAPGFLLPATAQIRGATNLPTSTSWLIFDPVLANDAIANRQTDLVMLARELLRDPQWPYRAAKALGVEQPQNVLPVQYAQWLKR